MASSFRNFALWVIAVLLLLGLFTLFQNPDQRRQGREITFSQFLTEVDQGRVRDVLIAGQEVQGSFSDGQQFTTMIVNAPALIERLRSKNVSITVRPQQADVPWFVSLIISWLPFIALIGVWIFLSRQMQTAKAGASPPAAEIEALKRRIDDLERRIDRLGGK